ncbi:bifunctional 4-hydroxy-2-oxoglutarate aldolase/2-dehydro-3-deoxy-phosphogluconate aldolase [Gilliamella sp. B3464]|uniref:bifunctional 4-hydroxy-2-oxoglutarate aldolase/2-dehydro-3-deoxy-phosphogluconate aldolase n=1 Tax=unclassified Gilliamella TaxID=2685620 RepID=UPI002269CA62|nr:MULTISPECIES: bifunctional 4-hydroxy-2-oxoglutarate aldolase/2-dehydro-3-deoxy-phosphogluconate aldolase [unclassified Gilliamella]MCX8712616.1 bifunctional 4-hydroxy-2-oxoglutarate aldolase/2-dehydro-3-deoxy-phosphogluconate aldolase [Gilliamella sp. B3468]MCX8727624.1 bifunctional 4-hydroxy-2-oxoglutarate aldolase/2-dehydro-3-deoxy-phosphogluconate aldolase [Gilliamella sp. B2838]MCX8739083.1 bifunctional 4-hydroxy-2-oxoglutarate aldolase/2-dehydro-3-deoxy-phosphogluconate aldolase [Gilliam
MYRKLDNLNKIVDSGIVLIVRLATESESIKVAEAAIEGGINVIEIPMAVPNALQVVKYLSDKYRNKGILVGTGTVLDGETARAAILAGAELLVSPNLNPEMIKVANRYQVVTMSGAYTPTEIQNTLEAGADIVKLFPAEFVNPSYVKSVLAPLSHAPISPTGGVTPENVHEWFSAGAVCVGVASYITKAAAQDNDYSKVTKAAQNFIAAVNNAKNK